ncbi:MAG: hypothetical protein RJA07_1068 [Bacteroidota bacterium]|jgi:hypothetical protein
MKNKLSALFLLAIFGMLIFASCHSSSVWGHKDAETPTKFRSDKRYIRK